MKQILSKPVDFELAKLLKEKGFNNESAHYYNEKGEMLFDTYYPSLQPTKPDVYYDNPTIAEVIMWLYDKHGIWIEVVHRTLWGFSLNNVKKGCFELERLEYNSPTEAYEAAIEYVLTKLI